MDGGDSSQERGGYTWGRERVVGFASSTVWAFTAMSKGGNLFEETSSTRTYPFRCQLPRNIVTIL